MTLKRIGRSTWMALLIAAGCASRHSSDMKGGSGMTDQLTEASTAGMWLPEALPAERLKQVFGFSPSPEWAEHLRLSSVRIGASGSFVSPDGLVLTNHHVAVGALHNISREGRDYVANGFLAKSREEEQKLPGMELSVLVSIEDVTPRVEAAVKPELSPEDAVKARNAVMADIEREAKASTLLQCNVVTLYGGAQFHLYRYRKYSDIRAVFAPEVAIAFFGGDTDNFEFPRYDLDFTLLRAYEDGKPARIKDYLHLAPHGVKEGDAIFVSGHPGRTERLLPVAALQSMRDLTLAFAGRMA